MKPIQDLVKDMQEGGLLCDPLSTATVIGYEAGAVVKSAFYSLVRDQAEKKAQIDFMGTEISDLIIQLKVLCFVSGLDWRGMEQLGEDRVYDTINKFKPTPARPNGISPADNLWENVKNWPPFNHQEFTVRARPFDPTPSPAPVRPTPALPVEGMSASAWHRMGGD